jgi:hypothetical protein
MRISIPLPEKAIETELVNGQLVLKLANGVFMVHSNSRPPIWHFVYLKKYDAICTCEDYNYNDGKECRHIRVAQKYGKE